LFGVVDRMRCHKCFGRALILSGLFAAQVQTTPCSPTFKAETTYAAGTTVSSSFVEHTTEPCAPDLTHQADNKTSLCNADGTRPVAITRTYNYRCVDGPKSLYCRQGWAFGPASLYGHVAWEKLEECYSETALFPSTWSAGDGCPAEYDSYNDGIGSYSSHYDPGDLVSVPMPASERAYGENKVYRCKDQGFEELDHHRAQISQCGQVGFEPDGLYGHLVWEFLGNCTGALPSPELVLGYWGRRCPAPWIEMDWVPGHLPDNTYEYARHASYYEPGDLVSEGNVVYQCRRFPDYRHCGQAGYHPPKSPATPGAWKDAWTPQGICDLNYASTAPTSSPSFDVLDVIEEGCPEVWQSSRSYYGGDLVSFFVSDAPMRRIVYQCRGYPYERYCNQVVFQPGMEYEYISWTVIGACDKPMVPTQSPSVYGGVCDYTKCTTALAACQCDSPDCPNPLVLTVGCTKTIETCESKDVEPYLSTRNYDYGDVVRVGLVRYVCLGFPFGLWCNNPAYQPALVGGIWSDAWRRDGMCPSGPTQSPTPPAPSTPSPSKVPTQAPSTSPSRKPTSAPTPYDPNSSSPTGSPVCTETEILFGSGEVTRTITDNNIGGRDGSNSNKFAMITNVGSYLGQPFNLKLESDLANGDDSNCSPGSAANLASCSISLNSNGAVDFFVNSNSVHPIRFTFIDASGNQITPLPRFSFSVFDVGNSGEACELGNASNEFTNF